MSEAWKDLDLEGDGLQSANIKLAGMLKKRTTAYFLLGLLLPLGQHRTYLDDRVGAWGYRVASLLAIALFLFGHTFSGGVVLLLIGAFVVYDIRWVDNRVAALNKALRVKVYMHQGSGVPTEFRGRFDDDNNGGPGGPPQYSSSRPSRVPSFAEQEAMLRELAERKKNPPANE